VIVLYARSLPREGAGGAREARGRVSDDAAAEKIIPHSLAAAHAFDRDSDPKDDDRCACARACARACVDTHGQWCAAILDDYSGESRTEKMMFSIFGFLALDSAT
jgi:hypothetical protein